ncbi:MAG: rod-binding protein [Syntrophomonas sp.]
MLSSVNNYVSNQSRNLVLASKTSSGSTDFATQFASALKSENSKKLYGACQDLESVFVNTVIKTMRQSIQKSGLMGDSFAEETYQSMLDEEYSKQISKTKSLGIADMLYKQLSQNISDEVSDIKSTITSQSDSSQQANSTQENTSSNYGTTTVSSNPVKSNSVKTANPIYELSDTVAPAESMAVYNEDTGSVIGPANDKYVDFKQANWQLKWNEMWGKYNQIVTQSTNSSNVGKSITSLNWGNDHPVIWAQQYATGRLTNPQGDSIEVSSLGSSNNSNQSSNTYTNNSSNSTNTNSSYSSDTNSSSSTSDNSDADYSDGWAS